MGNRVAIAEKVSQFWNCGLDVTTGGTVTPKPQFQKEQLLSNSHSISHMPTEKTNKQKTIGLDYKNNNFTGASRPPHFIK